MVIIEVCQIFSWDFYTYLAQPSWFLDLIIEKMKIDAKKSEAEFKKSRQTK